MIDGKQFGSQLARNARVFLPETRVAVELVEGVSRAGSGEKTGGSEIIFVIEFEVDKGRG